MLEFEFELGEGPPLAEVLEVTDSEGDVGPSLLGKEPWMLFGIKILIGGLNAAEIWLEACDWMISSGFKKTLESDFSFRPSKPFCKSWSFMKYDIVLELLFLANLSSKIVFQIISCSANRVREGAFINHVDKTK